MCTPNEQRNLAAELRLSIDKINAIKSKLEKEGFTVMLYQELGKSEKEQIHGPLVGTVERHVKEKLL